MIARVTGPVTARCGTTMCEIVAHYGSEIPAKRQNAAWQIVQGKTFRDAISRMGLRSDDASFAANGIVLFVSRLPG